jgi:enoyl-CoA hydratase/carnithine racemase
MRNLELQYARAGATFRQTEALGGVMPGFGGTWRLARRVGFQLACELMKNDAGALSLALRSDDAR